MLLLLLQTDKSTVVSEIIKYIQSLQLKLDILVKKRQQMLEARALSQTVVPTVSLHHPMEPPKTSPAAAAAVVTPENLAISLLDHQGNAHHGNHESSMLYVQEQQQQQADLAAMSANLNHPLQQQEIIQQTDSCLQSFLGANVGLHICGSNAFITISSPRGQRGIFHRILVTVQNQHLDVINAFISTSKASIFHCLHCQVPHCQKLHSQQIYVSSNTLHMSEPAIVFPEHALLCFWRMPLLVQSSNGMLQEHQCILILLC